MLHILGHNLRKTGSIAQNINFYAKHFIAKLPKKQRIKQLKVYSKMYIQINYDYATLRIGYLLLQNLQIEGKKLIKQILKI